MNIIGHSEKNHHFGELCIFCSDHFDPGSWLYNALMGVTWPFTIVLNLFSVWQKVQCKYQYANIFTKWMNQRNTEHNNWIVMYTYGWLLNFAKPKIHLEKYTTFSAKFIFCVVFVLEFLEDVKIIRNDFLNWKHF